MHNAAGVQAIEYKAREKGFMTIMIDVEAFDFISFGIGDSLFGSYQLRQPTG